jgi:hypothetical protein
LHFYSVSLDGNSFGVLEAYMISRLAFATSLMLLVAFGSVRGPLNLSAAGATPQSPAQQGMGQGQSQMQAMMKMQEQMIAEMKADDAKLDALVNDMNAASGNGKVNAVATVVNELVRQHKAMHARMAEMHQEMMGGPGMMNMMKK